MLPTFEIFENRFSAWSPILTRFLQPQADKGRSDPSSEEKRPKIGLALSSGGSKGLAHIGVIQVLEENGIAIDAIAGTSMGAYVGACWAGGLNGEALEAFAAEIATPWDRLSLLDPVFPPRKGFLKGNRIKERLIRAIGDKDFEQLDRRLLVIATEMETYDSHIFEHGKVAEAVHASLAIPGICWPVEIGGLRFVDGGVSDPLPVRALFDAGMDCVIAVSVIPTVDELRLCREQTSRLNKRSGLLSRFLAAVNKHLNYFASGNILDILRSSALGSQIRVAEFNGALADVYLRPIICTGNWHDYHHFADYIAEGRRVALENLEPIKALAGNSTKARQTPLQPSLST